MAKHERTTAEETAKRLRGTNGRLFIRREDGWLDTETGNAGTLHVLAEKWNTECLATRQDSQALDEGD